MPPDILPGTYIFPESSVAINNRNSKYSFVGNHVILLLLFCGLISAAVVTVTTGARRSSRSRKENTRFTDYAMEVDLEVGSPQDDNNANHPHPSHSPEWYQDSPATRTRVANNRRQQQHRAAVRAGGRRVASPRRRRSDGVAVSRAMRNLTTLLTAVNHVQCMQAEKDALAAEYEAYTAAAGFVRDHGDPAEYTATTAEQAQQEVDVEALERELHELAAGFDLEVLQQDLEDMEMDAGGLSDPEDDDWAPPRHIDCQQHRGGGRSRRGRPRRPLQPQNVGTRTIVCHKCGAKLWKGEKPGICCSSGKSLNLATHFSAPAPEPLLSLMLGTHPESAIFKAAIRKFNNTLAMASSGLSGNHLPGVSFLAATGIGRVHHFMAPPAGGGEA